VLGPQLVLLQDTNEQEIDQAFAKLFQQRASALLVSGDAVFTSRREQIAGLAERYAVASCFANREQVAIGGLMSYGANRTNTSQQGRQLCRAHPQGREAG
jgi:putative tryptophan/tyrosine transport system substrate-binding protein